MKTEDFLDVLEQRELVPSTVVDSIREKVQRGQHRITSKSVLKFLVKRELITRRQAKQLLETTLTVTDHAESSILGMVPMPKISAEEKPRKKPAAKEEIPTLAPVEPVNAEPVEEATEQDDLGDFVSDSISAVGTSSLSELSAESDSLEAASTEGEGAGKKSKKKQKKKNEWDSPLILLGGGGLVVLLVVGVIFFVLLNRENAEEVLGEASEYFDGGSYTQAISQYEKFVENFPRHAQISAAKVRLGMAQLWKATSSDSRYSEALETAQRVLEELEDEPDFPSAQRDLASLLPKIAQGLANQAEQANEAETVTPLLEQTKIALALCANTKYILKKFRNETVLEEIGQTVLRVERGQEQKKRLGTSLVEIQVALDSQDTATAYSIHRKLLEAAPGLLHNEVLAAKVKEISAAEKLEVKFVAETKSAETLPRPSKVVATLTLAEKRGKPATGVEGTLAVRVDGAVYGIHAEDGALLWRKFVGFDAESTPLALPGGDVLVVDATHHELLRLHGSTGELVWRLAFKGPILRPTIAGEQLLVVESSGKLHVVEAASGNFSGYVQFSQSLPVPPTVNKRGTRIYLLGGHSSLFTLSAKDFSCQGVFYLGHEQGGVSTPVAAVLNKVVAAVNTGIATSQLQVMAADRDGLPTEITTTRRQNGLINTRLLVAGRRLVTLTTSGQISVYEVGAETGDQALTLLASRDPESGPPTARFGQLHEGHIWAAGMRLNKLEILPTGNRLPIRNLDQDYLGDTFDHPLQSVGKLLVHVRRPADRAGAIVAAMEPAAGKALWETELAVPPAGAPAIDAEGKRIIAATASGATYVLDRQSISRRVQDQATRLSKSSRAIRPLTENADLGKGRLAIASVGTKTLLHFRPASSKGQLRAISLAGPASTAPILWRDGFVVPTQVGQVFLFGSEDGKQLGSPFQPPLAPGAKYDWLTPAVFGSGETSRLVLSDGVEKIYLIAQRTEPKPHLAAEAEAEVGASPLNTRLAVVGNLVCAGTADGRLAHFQLPSLEASEPIDLGSQIEWGPFSVGNRVLFATDSNELVCLDEQAQISWRQPLAHGRPAGTPLDDSGAVLLLWQEGGISRLDLSDGTEANHVALDHPVVAGPVPFGNRLVLSSYDGTLLVVERP
ncbi:MAG: PQQ-binding-like beta-propeller repeat protein [Planctomycetes bacterium]|nr:PQQ-binding-like beta-propeller repeat protein [Planctomycetota bacterium]